MDFKIHPPDSGNIIAIVISWTKFTKYAKS